MLARGVCVGACGMMGMHAAAGCETNLWGWLQECAPPDVCLSIGVHLSAGVIGLTAADRCKLCVIALIFMHPSDEEEQCKAYASCCAHYPA